METRAQALQKPVIPCHSRGSGRKAGIHFNHFQPVIPEKAGVHFNHFQPVIPEKAGVHFNHLQPVIPAKAGIHFNKGPWTDFSGEKIPSACFTMENGFSEKCRSNIHSHRFSG